MVTRLEESAEDALTTKRGSGTHLLHALAEAFPVAFHHAVQDRFLGPVTLIGRVLVKRRMRAQWQGHGARPSALHAARNLRAMGLFSSIDRVAADTLRHGDASLPASTIPPKAADRVDVLILGSGAGGAVTALTLAEHRSRQCFPIDLATSRIVERSQV